MRLPQKILQISVSMLMTVLLQAGVALSAQADSVDEYIRLLEKMQTAEAQIEAAIEPGQTASDQYKTSHEYAISMHRNPGSFDHITEAQRDRIFELIGPSKMGWQDITSGRNVLTMTSLRKIVNYNRVLQDNKTPLELEMARYPQWKTTHSNWNPTRTSGPFLAIKAYVNSVDDFAQLVHEKQVIAQAAEIGDQNILDLFKSKKADFNQLLDESSQTTLLKELKKFNAQTGKKSDRLVRFYMDQVETFGQRSDGEAVMAEKLKS